MTRALFISEQRYIRNVLFRHRHIEVGDIGRVVLEYYPPPRRRERTRFNCDFVLQFDDHLDNFVSCSTGILPHAVGADVFVTFEEGTMRPLRSELLGGDAFSVRYFLDYIEQLEDRLALLSQPVDLRECAYLRVFVIDNDICFLAFPGDFVPVAQGRTRVLCSDSESLIVCSFDGPRLVYFDGWLRTSVADSEHTLLALDLRPATHPSPKRARTSPKR